MFVDSHCHLYMLDLSPQEKDMADLINSIKSQGVSALLCVGVDMDTSRQCQAIAMLDKDVYCSVGSHPSEKEEDDLSFETLCAMAAHPKVVAIGETGLDYYYNDSNLKAMQDRFGLHIQVARETKKPLIIHTRNACDDTLAIMRSEHAREAGGVMHCFTESLAMAKASLDLGFYISFSGIITFKNAEEVRDVVRYVPMESLLIETDSPYLAPVPYRGKPNTPIYVRHVAEKIAEIKNISVEEVARVTSENFYRFIQVS